LIWIINQWVRLVFAKLPLNSSGMREKLAQKRAYALKKFGQGAMSLVIKNFSVEISKGG